MVIRPFGVSMIPPFLVHCWAPVLCALGLLAFHGSECLAQVASGALKQPAFGVVRMRARPKIGGAEKKIERKRFYMIKGTMEENKSLFEVIDKATFLSRECYYRRVNASCSLIKWLKANNCETPYCRDITTNDVEGKDAVPEFQTAYNKSKEEFRKAAHGQGKIALGWVTNNLPDSLRIGFYRERQKELDSLLKLAEERSKSKVLSVMTDRNGTAYFTDIEPGDYVISNLIPIETEKSSVVINCEVKVQPVDLGQEKPFTMNQANKKCSIIEKPLDVCEKEGPCK